MVRRRFRNSRHHPDSERSLYEQHAYSTHLLGRQDLLNLIRGGEDSYVEFKVRLTNDDKITAEIIALANSGGGAMIFGVNDKCRIEGLDNIDRIEEQILDICRNQILPPVYPYIDRVAFDNGKRILVLEVKSKSAPHCTREGRFYIRMGSSKQEASREELMQLYDTTRPVEFENVPLVSADLDDIDEAALWSYVRAQRGAEFGQAEQYPTYQVMLDMALATNYRDAEGSDIVPTLGGLLLFGRNERVREVFRRSSIMTRRFSGATANGDVIEELEISGTLSTLYEGTVAFIRRYADLWDAPRRVARSESLDAGWVPRADYSRPLVIEAVVNALVHRDYSAAEPPAHVDIYDDHIEISNACRMRWLRAESVRYGVVATLNPRLKSIFTNPLYGFDLPKGGVPMMLREANRFSTRAPEFRIAAGEFRVRIEGTTGQRPV